MTHNETHRNCSHTPALEGPVSQLRAIVQTAGFQQCPNSQNDRTFCLCAQGRCEFLARGERP